MWPAFGIVLLLLCMSVASGGYAGWYTASNYPPQYIVRHEPPVASDGSYGVAQSSSKRNVAVWAPLEQREVDAITKAVDGLHKNDANRKLTIFCESDSRCGDLQMDFDNAFESAHWKTAMERPLIDDTIGIAASSPELVKAINDATGGRLAVKLIPKNAPYFALAIGKKSREPVK